MAEGIRIGGGKKSGTYVWKKCEYFPEHTLTSASFKIASTDGTTFNITDANFNLLSIKEETNFLVGFTNGTVYFSLVDNRLVLQVNEAAYVNSITVSKDGKSAVVIVGAAIGTGTFTLSCANKTIPSVIGEFIDFVVSDNPTAYPDGGEQGGYWYEKVVEGIDLLSIGNYTSIAVDKFTLSTKPTSNFSISHSLGKIPRAFIILGKATSVIEFYAGANFGHGLWTTPESSASYGSTSKSPTDTTVTLFSSSQPGNRFEAGVEYTLITMA